MSKKHSGIVHQNKDVISKIFGENIPNKSFSVYGIDVPKVIALEPTNLPAIELNEQRMDNLYLLEDGSYAIVDYESKYLFVNKLKYLGYILRALRRLEKANIDIKNVKIRVIIIYTADVQPKTTIPFLNVGSLKMDTKEAFLVEINGEEIINSIESKISNNIPLNDEDMMKLIILPLTYKGKTLQRKMIHKAVNLAKRISDEEKQKFALAGILCFSDKVIEKNLAYNIAEELSMTKVEKCMTEKITKRVTEELTQKLTDEVTQKVTDEVTQKVTKKYKTEYEENGIKLAVSLTKEFGGSMLDAIEKIMDIFHLERNYCEEKVQLYWNL